MGGRVVDQDIPLIIECLAGRLPSRCICVHASLPPSLPLSGIHALRHLPQGAYATFTSKRSCREHLIPIKHIRNIHTEPHWQGNLRLALRMKVCVDVKRGSQLEKWPCAHTHTQGKEGRGPCGQHICNNYSRCGLQTDVRTNIIQYRPAPAFVRPAVCLSLSVTRARSR